MPLPNASPKASVECFWQAKGRTMRYETQAHILRLLVSASLPFAYFILPCGGICYDILSDYVLSVSFSMSWCYRRDMWL